MRSAWDGIVSRALTGNASHGRINRAAHPSLKAYRGPSVVRFRDFDRAKAFCFGSDYTGPVYDPASDLFLCYRESKRPVRAVPVQRATTPKPEPAKSPVPEPSISAFVGKLPHVAAWRDNLP